MLGRVPCCIASHNLHWTLTNSIQYILIKEARPHLVHLRQSTDARKWASLVPMSGIAERERLGEYFLDVTLLFHFVVRIILCSTVYSFLVVLTHILPSHESRPVFPLKLSVHGAVVLRSTAGSICATRGLLLKLSKEFPMPHRDCIPVTQASSWPRRLTRPCARFEGRVHSSPGFLSEHYFALLPIDPLGDAIRQAGQGGY